METGGNLFTMYLFILFDAWTIWPYNLFKKTKEKMVEGKGERTQQFG